MAQVSETYQMTKPAPIVWVNVVTPRPAGEANQEAYQATFVLTKDHPDFAPMVALMAKVVKDKFGATKDRKFPLKRGDDSADTAAAAGYDREWARGKELFNTKAPTRNRKSEALNPPRLVVLVNDKYVRYADEQRGLAKPYFYSGVLAIGSFSFVAYEGFGGGVTAYLNEILSLNAGDKINTGIDDETKYGAPTQYIGKVSAKDTAGAEEISY